MNNFISTYIIKVTSIIINKGNDSTAAVLYCHTSKLTKLAINFQFKKMELEGNLLFKPTSICQGTMDNICMHINILSDLYIY